MYLETNSDSLVSEDVVKAAAELFDAIVFLSREYCLDICTSLGLS